MHEEEAYSQEEEERERAPDDRRGPYRDRQRLQPALPRDLRWHEPKSIIPYMSALLSTLTSVHGSRRAVTEAETK